MLLKSKINTKLFNQTRSASFKPSIFHPSDVHVQLQETVRNFTEKEIRPQVLFCQYPEDLFQAKVNDANETFNQALFKRLGTELGILGITVSEQV